MNILFLKTVNASITASWLILAVIILRLFLKKTPKWIRVALWGVVAFRLVCPFSFESTFSLIPSAETIPLNIETNMAPTIHSGIDIINKTVNPQIIHSNTPADGASINPLQITVGIFENLWILGIALMLIYSVISYAKLRRKVRTAVRYKDNIFLTENVVSPFVLGIIKPRIYMPFTMASDAEYIIAHELAHLSRMDHLWKPMGFAILTIHWFNPLMWLAYVLLCRDIELACDEKVIKKLNCNERADYTQTLLACSINRRMIAACPLAFGEIGVKARIRSVLHYKKPSFWIVISAFIICAAVAFCFLTDPVAFHFDTETDIIVSASCIDTRNTSSAVTANMNRAQIDELASRLSGIKNSKRSDRYSGLTPAYKINALMQNDEHIIISSYSLSENAVVDITHNGNRYVVNDEDFKDYVSRICTRNDVTYAKPTLTLNDVVTLSKKAGALTWSDFEQYNYVETGSGLYIRVYRIDDTFELWIGGSGPESEPMYIYLALANDIETRIEIRNDSGIEEFINDHRSSQKTISMVMINGVLYRDTGIVKIYTSWNANADGIITSAVHASEIPSVDGQSNFGTGYSYLYGTSGGTVEIHMDGMVRIFATEEVYEKIRSGVYDTSEAIIHYPAYRTLYVETAIEDIQEKYDNEEFIITKLHYENLSGEWACEGYTYKYRLEISGRLNNAAKNTTYIVLSNTENITFDMTWKAAGFSSNLADYFDPSVAVIVGHKLFS
ncbi:MAG: hypothetical protein IKV97_03555 [Clostridia bacterium]|nr:hypothetical protein [Clostridia bacterium]